MAHTQKTCHEPQAQPDQEQQTEEQTMSEHINGALKALKSERIIRKQAETNTRLLADELALSKLQITKISAENLRFREDNRRLTAANKKLENGNRHNLEMVRRRDQKIKALQVQVTEMKESK